MKTTLARRRFLSLTATAVAGTVVQGHATAAVSPNLPVQAIAFDAFPIFDPRPIFALAEELFPGRGAGLSKAWRTRQFEYTWLRTIARRYVDFWQVTEDALVFAARDLKLDLDSKRRTRLMSAYLEFRSLHNRDIHRSGYEHKLLRCRHESFPQRRFRSRRHSVLDPCSYLVFNPTDGLRSHFNAAGKVLCTL